MANRQRQEGKREGKRCALRLLRQCASAAEMTTGRRRRVKKLLAIQIRTMLETDADLVRLRKEDLPSEDWYS